MDEKEEFAQNVKEDVIYQNLLYEQRKSLGEDHEPEEIEECMKYVYPDILRRKARVLAHDFSPYQPKDTETSGSEDGNERKITLELIGYLLSFGIPFIAVTLGILLLLLKNILNLVL